MPLRNYEQGKGKSSYYYEMLLLTNNKHNVWTVARIGNDLRAKSGQCLATKNTNEMNIASKMSSPLQEKQLIISPRSFTPQPPTTYRPHEKE